MEVLKNRRIRRAAATIVMAAFVLAFGAMHPGHAATESRADGVQEYELKAALLLKLVAFVNWKSEEQPRNPEGETSEEGEHDESRELLIGVLGKDPFGPLLDQLAIQASNGRLRFKIMRTASPSDASACDVLFVCKDAAQYQGAVLEMARASQTLTVSDIEGFAESGGMVELAQAEKRVGLVINNNEAKEAGISVSSKLLSLARLVENK